MENFQIFNLSSTRKFSIYIHTIYSICLSLSQSRQISPLINNTINHTRTINAPMTKRTKKNGPIKSILSVDRNFSTLSVMIDLLQNWSAVQSPPLPYGKLRTTSFQFVVCAGLNIFVFVSVSVFLLFVFQLNKQFSICSVCH